MSAFGSKRDGWVVGSRGPQFTIKMLVALWATEQAKPRSVLVLLPSLMLLQQTLQEWSQQTSWGSRFSYLCVCSGKTVGLKNDSINIDKSELGFKVDTDPEMVRLHPQSATICDNLYSSLTNFCDKRIL